MLFNNIVEYIGYAVGVGIYIIFSRFIRYLCISGKKVSNTISTLAIVSILSYGLCSIGIGFAFNTEIQKNHTILNILYYLVQVGVLAYINKLCV